MPRDPIERLLEEHAELLRRFAPLRAALRDLDSGGRTALDAALPALRASR